MDVPTEFVSFAEKLADVAGEVILRYWRKPVEVESKLELHRPVAESPVTEADREAEQRMRELIEAQYPSHGIIGEEFGNVRAEAEFVWVLDPIDGTKSFITGKPLFGTLIALLHKGTPVLGVIDQCVLKERWVGANGQTVFNQRPVRAKGVRQLSEAMMYATTPHMFSPGLEEQRFRELQLLVKRPLYGCDCYAYGLVAAGFGADLVVEADLGPLRPPLQLFALGALLLAAFSLRSLRLLEKAPEDSLRVHADNVRLGDDHALSTTASVTTTKTTSAGSSATTSGGIALRYLPHVEGGTLGQRGQSHSQVGQDWLVLSLLNCQKQGFFVDLAANDAVDLSNTLMLERDFEWTGLCIEANQIYLPQLQRRRCRVIQAAVGSPENQPAEFKLSGIFGGIVGKEFDNHEGGSDTEVFLLASLERILLETKVPRVIDYMSLDVEGAETAVMKTFPWKTHHIRVLGVERPKDELKAMLQEEGHTYLRTCGRYGDETWVHRSFGLDVQTFLNGQPLNSTCMTQRGFPRPATWTPDADDTATALCRRLARFVSGSLRFGACRKHGGFFCSAAWSLAYRAQGAKILLAPCRTRRSTEMSGSLGSGRYELQKAGAVCQARLCLRIVCPQQVRIF
ncbi:unnamed protein product [Effrenium voratum]|nr:unnamed protein product [Effrenium voratum]